MRIVSVPGTASLRSWTGNDEQNCGVLAIQLELKASSRKAALLLKLLIELTFLQLERSSSEGVWGA